MGIFFDEKDMAEIRERFKDSTYFPKWAWVVIGALILAVIGISITIHYLPS